MSLKTTADELRERAYDVRHPEKRPWDNEPEELAAHLTAMASELDSYPDVDDIRLIVCGGAADQRALDKAVARVRVAVCEPAHNAAAQA